MRNLNKPLNILAVLCALGGSLAGMGVTNIALAASNQSAVNAITGIELENLPDGKLVLKFNLKNPASSPSAFALTNPARVALDFAGTQNLSGKNAHAFNQGFLRTVTLVQAGNRTRAIVNLNSNVSYDTKAEGNQLIVTLQSVNTVASQISPSTQAPVSGKQEVQNIDFRRGVNGEGKVVIELSDNNTGVDVRVQGGKIVVDVLQNHLPSHLQKRFDVTDFATPVTKVDAFENNGNTRVEITPTGNWEYSAYQANNRYIVEVKKQDLESAKANATNDKINKKTVYKGEKLSMNFQDVPVRTVLQVIAEFTKKNIVTTDTVTGNLTLRLQDVPWDQALDLILQTRNLDKRENGNVIMVAPKEEFTAKEKAELESRKALVQLEPLRSETFQLKYMQASDFKKFLEESSKQDTTNQNIERRAFLSNRGSAIMADRSNMLFVNDIQSKLDEIRYLIEQIDVPSRQVMIEARIVEADDDFSRDLGVKLGFTRGNKGFSVGGNLGQATSIAGGGDYNSSMVNVNLPVAAAGSIGALIGNSLSSGLLGLELSALESDGRGKILSNPRVVTSNLIEASIEQGTEVPYQTISGDGTKTEFKKAVLQLKVLPQITPDGNLIMKVLVTKDSPRIIGSNSTGAVIAVDTKQVNTEVMVENGGTIVIGGIYTESESDSVTKVPLLGDIPVVGNLFKTKSRSNAKKELLIFITPKILDDKLTLR